MNKSAEYVAAIAYEGYCRALGGVSPVDGKTLPDFFELPEKTKTVWLIVAAAVIDEF